MFLAWKEIIYSKTRFSLIIGIVVLVAYLVSFLTGLSNGLAQENKDAVDKWQADSIVLAEESNLSLNMSMLTLDDADTIAADQKAVLGISSNIVRLESSESSEDNIDVTIFGIKMNEFLVPEIVEGKAVNEQGEVIADLSLKEEKGIEIGDILNISGKESSLKVVGFTDKAKFSVSPVLYTQLDTYQDISSANRSADSQDQINAIILRDERPAEEIEINNSALTVYSIDEFVNNLPGYNAQVLTFGLMIGFLILIAALVIGIFIYVLTLQKASMIGVMKAQGISSNYISKSIIAQTLILALLGVLIGFGLTILTGLFLPAAVPYQNNYIFLAAVMAGLLVFALLGAVFSVRTIVKVDPLVAIE